MRTYSAAEALNRHPEITPNPVSVSALRERFRPTPPSSTKALLIRMGPFDPMTDGFLFTNSFHLTVDNIEEFVRMLRDEAVESVLSQALRKYTKVMDDLSFDVPFVGSVGVPDAITGTVVDRVEAELAAEVIDGMIDPLNPFGKGFGRCGGMAFAGYDFYLQGWSVDSFQPPPPTEGELGDYIFTRLIDSLELNGKKFLDWLVELYVLPKVDPVANAAFGAAAGSVGGPLGVAIGAFLGSKSNAKVFDLGGADSILERTKQEWIMIKNQLDEQAAWPIGLIYGDTSSPFDQHQVLAIGYTDNGLGTATLTIWNNNNLQQADKLQLDFRGSRVKVSGFIDDGNNHVIRGIFAEEYNQRRPPLSLKRA